MSLKVQHISLSINKPKEVIYAFASEAANFPKWLAFMQSISQKMGNIWTAETDIGTLEIALPPKNDFGILDNIVTLPDGSKVNNPLRIIPNGEASEVVFTLFRMPGTTQKQFDEDALLVAADLKTLKKIVEKL